MKYLFIAACMLPLRLSAQHSVIDSLNTVISQAKHDTIKVQALKTLSWHYYFAALDQTPLYVRRMIAVSERSHYIKGIWDGYNIMGMWHYTNMQYDSAIHWLKKGFSLSTDPGYYPQQVYALNYIATCFVAQAEYDSAAAYAHTHIKVATESKDNSRIAKAYKSLALVYYDQGEYYGSLKHFLKADSLMGDEVSIDRGEAFQNISQLYHILGNQPLELKYLQNALNIYQQMNDDYGISAVEMSFGSLDLSNRNYDQARIHFETALKFFETYNDPRMRANAYRYLGRSYYFLKEPEKALTLYEKALVLLEPAAEGDITRLYCYHEMGEVLVALRQYPKAEKVLQTALAKTEIAGGLNEKADILRSIAVMYQQQGNFKKAFAFQQQFQTIADTLNQIKASKQIVEVEARYQNEKKEREIVLLGAQHQLTQRAKREQQMLFIFIIASVVTVAVVLYFLLKTKQKSNRKLRELDEMKSRFFANISHEFRTPLTLIAGPVESRLNNPSIPADEKSDLEMINRNSRQLLSLVDQLLVLSKLESDNLQLCLEKGDVSALISALASSFRYLAEQKKIDYHVAISDIQHEVWYDRDVIQKIVTNLLSNACKYTPEHGTLKLSAETVKGMLTITVANSGPGIATQELPKIFERFYQVDGRSGGMGIGLALVKELIVLLKGDIKVNSLPGELTTFIITIPVEKEVFPKARIVQPRPITRISNTLLPEEAAHSHNGFPDDDTSGLPVLLVVEDHAEVRSFIRTILQGEYQILEAANGKAGIDLALEHIPDLIISDVMMPDTDGLALCAKLKTHEFTSHIPVILLTAKAGDENVLTGFEAGADDYITKPFSSALLRVRIQKLIELRRTLHERYSHELVLKPKQIAVSSTDEQFLRKIEHILDSHLTNSDFTVEMFASEIGMSRMQLHRKLKGLTGLSATNFIRSQRLTMAAQLLGKSGANISEIGYRVGFNDPSYFSKCFKETYHCTPTEFAARH